MYSNPLIWGLGSFQSCIIAPFVIASEEPVCLKSDGQIFSNGKLLTFGFEISPSLDSSQNSTFLDEFDDNIDNLTLNYQLIHERKGVLLSKSAESRGIGIDGCDKLGISRRGDKLFVTASSRFKVSPMHLHKSLTLSLSLEFSILRLTNSKSHRVQSNITYQVDDDEKDIRNAIENPKYKPQRVSPRRGKIAVSFIEPLKITIESKETCPESTLVQIDITNKHPHNDLFLFSVNLSMNTTVRDFDGDSSRIGERDQKVSRGMHLPSVDEGLQSRTSQKDSESNMNMNDDDQSTTSTDEGNVEEYLRIIRADRFFHVTELTTSNTSNSEGMNSSNLSNDQTTVDKTTHSTQSTHSNLLGKPDFYGSLRIKSGCSHKFGYRISVKNASNLVVGNFLTPLGIRYIDISPPETESASEIASETEPAVVLETSAQTNNISVSSSSHDQRSHSYLSSSSQVSWSLGTDYLNRRAFCRNVHVYNLCTAQSGFIMPSGHRDKRIYHGEECPDQDLRDQILVAIDGPADAKVNVLFQVLVRTTNLSACSKRFSLGIQERDNCDSSSILEFIAVEAVTNLGEIRPGDTVECVISILPLLVGELILDGFYLEESVDGRDHFHSDFIRNDALHSSSSMRILANSFPVRIT